MNQEALVVKQKAKTPATTRYEQDAGLGLENVSVEDVKLPFLKILEKTSEEVNSRNAKYVKGAEAGMILNTLTNQLYDGKKGINVVPAFYNRNFVEWADRGTGSGAPIDEYDVTDPVVKTTTRDKSNKDRLPNGNYLANTAYHYVLNITDDIPSTAVITMTFSRLVSSRRWNGLMMGLKSKTKDGRIITPPSFSHIYNLKTVQQTNTRGDWFVWDVTSVGTSTDDHYEMAKKFALNIKKGAIKAKHVADLNVDKDTPF